MNIVKAINDRVEQGLNLADQAIVDQDKLNEMKYTLEKIRTETLLTGKGSSVTKITICGLVGIITLVMLFIKLNDGDISGMHELLYPVGMLIGAYGVGKPLKAKIQQNGHADETGRYERESVPKGFRGTQERSERPETRRDRVSKSTGKT